MAKPKHNYQTGCCEACGMTLAVDYHHPEGREWIWTDPKNPLSTAYRMPKNPDNYIELCPLCHRLLHRDIEVEIIRKKVRNFWKRYWMMLLRNKISRDLRETGYDIRVGPNTGKFRIIKVQDPNPWGEPIEDYITTHPSKKEMERQRAKERG